MLYITLGKLIGLLFWFCPLLSILFLKLQEYKESAHSPCNGTIFLVFILLMWYRISTKLKGGFERTSLNPTGSATSSGYWVPISCTGVFVLSMVVDQLHHFMKRFCYGKVFLLVFFPCVGTFHKTDRLIEYADSF